MQREPLHSTLRSFKDGKIDFVNFSQNFYFQKPRNCWSLRSICQICKEKWVNELPASGGLDDSKKLTM